MIVSSGSKVDIRVMHINRGTAVDLRRTRTALPPRLAVPAHRQVRGLGGLQPVHDVEHHLAVVGFDGVVAQVTAGGVAAHTRKAAW